LFPLAVTGLTLFGLTLFIVLGRKLAPMTPK
jgi:hypothetical protein